MAPVLENTRDQELKLSALNRLVATSLHGLSNQFQTWKRNAKFQTLNNQNLVKYINMMKKYINVAGNAQMS